MPRTSDRLSVAVAAALVSIGLLGCGGGGGSGSSSTTAKATPSRAEFVKMANAACEDARTGLRGKIAEFERRRGDRRPEPGADAVHFVYLPAMEAQIWSIEKLGAPRGDEKTVDTMLDAEKDAVDAVAVIPRVPSIARAERRFARADRLFRAYGLSACTTGNDA